MPNGQGKGTRPDGSVYEGELRDGKPNGQGKQSDMTGVVYEGEYRDGTPNGKGKLTYIDGAVYEGECRDGVPNGQGKGTRSDGSVYEGEHRDGFPNGQGKQTDMNGVVYEGEFRDGEHNGKGKVTYVDGRVYKGDFRNGHCSKVIPDAVPQPKTTRRGHRGGKKKTKQSLPTVLEPDPDSTESAEAPHVDAAVARLCDLADAHFTPRPSPHVADDEPESSMGGQSTCIVCFADEKTHMAAPCGHICVCGACAAMLVQCPYCRASAAMWIRARLV